MNSQPEIFLNKCRVGIVSDIHIGVHQNSAVWHKITLDWAKWLKESFVSRDIKDIIICGDLFHYRDEIAVNTIHLVADILNLWKDFNIIMIVGNHDAYYRDRPDINSLSILKGYPNITVISSLHETDLFGKKAAFCPWGVKLSDIPRSDIVFGHFEIESFKYNHFKVCHEGFKSDELLKKSNLIVSGHFHLREERDYANGRLLYVGNPFQMDFGDVESTKGYYILDFTDLSYEFFENKLSPKHIKVSLTDLLTTGKITNTHKKMFANNFVKFYIDKQITSDEIDILIKKLFTLNPLSINVDHSTSFNYGIEDDADHDFSGVDIPTAIKDFIDLMDMEDKNEVLDYTLDLYRRCK